MEQSIFGPIEKPQFIASNHKNYILLFHCIDISSRGQIVFITLVCFYSQRNKERKKDRIECLKIRIDDVVNTRLLSNFNKFLRQIH